MKEFARQFRNRTRRLFLKENYANVHGTYAKGICIMR